MIYESSYASGGKPYRPDVERGSWQKPTDFIYACLGLMMNLDSHFFLMHWGYIVSSVLIYFICMIVYVAPLMVIHSFMGQFSSSGFISAFRMSPIFKGIGYVSLVLGLGFLVYFSLIAAIPALFMLNSFRPTLPWSCEVWQNWSQNLTDAERINICNLTNRNELPFLSNETQYVGLDVPSVLYFRQHFENTDFESMDNIVEHEFSWIVIVMTVLVWALIAYVFYGHFETSKFGILLRYAIWLNVALSLISFLAFLQLPSGAPKNDLYNMHSFNFSFVELNMTFNVVIFFTLRSFGSGWGSVISLSSFNHFQTDIMRYSWIICIGQMITAFCSSVIDTMAYSHFESLITHEKLYLNVDFDWTLLIINASAIANMKWANLWSIIYYGRVLLSSLIVMSLQLFTILKSLFDEFEVLRPHKQDVTFGLIGCLAIISVYFTSNHGVGNYTWYGLDLFNGQLMLHLLLIVVAFWIYGRERLQRDFEFMLSISFATWKVNIVRYLGGFLFVVSLLDALTLSYYEHSYYESYAHIISAVLILVPFLLIPGYGIYRAFKTNGSFGNHWKNACKPIDWYPNDANDRRRYEELVGDQDFTQQLCEDAQEDEVA